MFSEARPSVFPAFQKVATRPVLVVGEGAEAAAKMRLLLETEAQVRLAACRPETGLAALIVAHDLDHRSSAVRDDDVDGAALVFAASGARAPDENNSRRGARGVPANAVDIRTVQAIAA